MAVRSCIENHEKLYILERDENIPEHMYSGATRVLFFVHRDMVWCALYFKYDSNKKPLLIQYTHDL